jgi:hypothetical protein
VKKLFCSESGDQFTVTLRRLQSLRVKVLIRSRTDLRPASRFKIVRVVLQISTARYPSGKGEVCKMGEEPVLNGESRLAVLRCSIQSDIQAARRQDTGRTHKRSDKMYPRFESIRQYGMCCM